MSGKQRAKFGKGTTAATDSVILGGNAWRTAIIFFPNGTSTYFVAFGEAAVSNSGIAVLSTGHPVRVSVEEYGDVVKSDVHVIAAGADNAPLVEISNPCCRREEG